MRTLTILLILLSSALLLWGLSRIVSSPAMYKSVHAMGHRFGTVLPQGYDGGSERPSEQLVRVHQLNAIEMSNPERPPASLRAKVQHRSDAAYGISSGFDRGLVTLIVMSCVCGALIAAVRMRRWSTEDAGNPIDPRQLQRRLFRACILVLPVGLVVGPMFVLARIFWTGVDEAFIERSIIPRAGSGSIHVLGDTTLSMNMPELLMLYLAVVMTALPTMLFIAVHAMGDMSGIRNLVLRSRISAPARGLINHPAVQARFNSRSMISVAVICYLLLTLVLWCAPWSTTLARAVWS